MTNITVSIDDETYRRCRTRAAELDTSVSAVILDFLRSFVGDSVAETRAETALERRHRLLREVFADFDARGVGLRKDGGLSREELYDRARTRTDAAAAIGDR